jgi:hypothetical protein
VKQLARDFPYGYFTGIASLIFALLLFLQNRGKEMHAYVKITITRFGECSIDIRRSFVRSD